jgi:hypothetical protein
MTRTRTYVRVSPGALHELTVAARLSVRSLARRLQGRDPKPAGHEAFRSALGRWVGSLPGEALAGHAFHFVPAGGAAWLDSGLTVGAGDWLTVLADGRVYLSRMLDLWLPPSFQLWYRVGESGSIFRGTRSTHTFAGPEAGRLWLGSVYPGNWLDPSGRHACAEDERRRASGGISVLILHWRPGASLAEVSRLLATGTRRPALVEAESARLAEPVVAPPDDWSYLWSLGPAEIYAPARTADGAAAVHCHTEGDTGILQREVRATLAPGTRLRWSWRVDELPTDLPEDTLPSHDYLSIAVEFDDGQDLTYYWSSSLPVGTAYRCPLPGWSDIETHVVARSGRGELGRWLREERDLHSDYQGFIGGSAREVVRVWFIANSTITRGRGRCEYAQVSLDAAGRKIEVL